MTTPEQELIEQMEAAREAGDYDEWGRVARRLARRVFNETDEHGGICEHFAEMLRAAADGDYEIMIENARDLARDVGVDPNADT